MRISHRGSRFIQSFEDCKLKAYPDPGTGCNPWTIGYGHTGPEVKPGMMITQDRADFYFLTDTAQFEKMVDDNVTVPLTQGQYDAMVSILFNVGHGSDLRDGIIRLRSGKPSTLLARLNDGDYPSAANQFLLWNRSGGRVMAGLTRRRTAERAMFLESDV